MAYLSSSCLKRERISDSVFELAEAGIKNIELSGGTRYYGDILKDVSALKEGYGLDYLVHGYFPPPKEDFILDLIAPSEAGRDRAISFIRESVSFCKALGVGVYSTHPGFTVDVSLFFEGAPSNGRGEIGKKEAERLFYDNLDGILGGIAGDGVRFAVENMYPLGGRPESGMLSGPDEILGFLEYSESFPALGFLMDLGHVNISARLLGYDARRFAEKVLEDYLHKVFEIRVSENSGEEDSHGITPDGSWQIDMLHIAESVKIPVVFEWRSGKKKDIITRYAELSGQNGRIINREV